ncbi:carbohydrate sulfotransferase 11-like [Saccoglossus kowalevskii]|uniref:Carbohydrate sulfotransferase n=1 Tax=Saccoglossus kowalevskii TaxID=10224 RepID=A0ABM0MEH1_SACKO|nr:PREDICTED: carbohydrate sulfotransferase 11-like [Saccoglossus kowalevskii]
MDGNLSVRSESMFLPKVDPSQHDLLKAVSYRNEVLPLRQLYNNNVTVEQLQAQRISTLKEGCAKARQNGIYFPHGGRLPIYNDEYKFMLCAVPKVATTSWKRVFLVLQGDANSTESLYHKEVQHRYHYPKLVSLYGQEEKFKLSMYTKVVFVREPFHRILSAYRNKLEVVDTAIYRKIYGRAIVKKYRKNPSPFSLKTGSDVTFHEFVEYLADPKTTFTHMDMHWRPMFKLCDVCNRNFDIIGKFEELQEDALYVLQRINASHVVKFPGYDTHVTNSSIEETYLQYYSTIPKELLLRLYKKYELDFQLFGYKTPSILT